MEAGKIYIDIPQIPPEEQEKYAGMDVAVIDGKVVAAGRNSLEALQTARALFPDRSIEEILISYIPKPEADFLVL